jgi:hypothetical protein
MPGQGVLVGGVKGVKEVKGVKYSSKPPEMYENGE